LISFVSPLSERAWGVWCEVSCVFPLSLLRVNHLQELGRSGVSFPLSFSFVLLFLFFWNICKSLGSGTSFLLSVSYICGCGVCPVLLEIRTWFLASVPELSSCWVSLPLQEATYCATVSFVFLLFLYPGSGHTDQRVTQPLAPFFCLSFVYVVAVSVLHLPQSGPETSLFWGCFPFSFFCSVIYR
jgi:hypothetical protein